VDTVFGIPGVHTIELYRGLAGSGIRHVTPRHEQGAGFMADGYARASGKPGVCLVISGPGVTNILTADGAGLRRLDPDAGDLDRQRPRPDGIGRGLAARTARPAAPHRRRLRLQPHGPHGPPNFPPPWTRPSRSSTAPARAPFIWSCPST
jgi:hypothetical protein